MSDIALYTTTGTMLAALATVATLQWRLIKSEVANATMKQDHLEKRLGELSERIGESPTHPSPHDEHLSIQLVSPPEYKPRRTNREPDEGFVTNTIRGVVHGPAAEAYLVLRALPSGRPRISASLELHDGSWESPAKIPVRENRVDFELWACALRQPLALPDGAYIREFPADCAVSRRIPLRVPLKDD